MTPRWFIKLVWLEDFRLVTMRECLHEVSIDQVFQHIDKIYYDKLQTVIFPLFGDNTAPQVKYIIERFIKRCFKLKPEDDLLVLWSRNPGFWDDTCQLTTLDPKEEHELLRQWSHFVNKNRSRLRTRADVERIYPEWYNSQERWSELPDPAGLA